ncbi:MAG: ABC transporter permease [Alphaproteobacteria bacterium]|nr:ABC transporter permease [Alphaproteobacteria bacterium]
MRNGISFYRIGAVLIKELRQLRRDKPTLGIMIMIPIVQLMLFGYAINTDPKYQPTALLIQDYSPFTRTLLAGFQNTDYFSMVKVVSNDREGHDLLQKGEVQFVITVPTNFARSIIRQEKPRLLIEADATDPTAAANALSALNGIITKALEHDMTGPLAALQPKGAAIDVTVHRLYNPEGFSRYNIVPGLMGVILTMTGIMMTALSLTREREQGTMENLLSMPVKPLEVMAGKIAPYVLIGYTQAAIILLAAKLLFGVPILGSVGLLSAALIIFLICNLALGFTVSAGARNQTQALQLSFFLIMPSILLSGFMFPFRGMPEWAQSIGSLLPATYFIRIVRGILLKGNDLVLIWPNAWPLFVFMLITMAIAMKLYKQTLD